MEIRDWGQFKERVAAQLFRQTGQTLDEWNARVHPPDRAGLGSSQMTARIPLQSVVEVGEEVAGWLRRAFDENL